MKKVIQILNNIWSVNIPVNNEKIKAIENSLRFSFPKEYVEFLEWSDGGEGQLKNGYLYLWKLEDLKQLNIDYGIQEFLSDDCIAIGTDGGDRCYGFDFSKDGMLFESPLGDLDYGEIKYLTNSFFKFIEDLGGNG